MAGVLRSFVPEILLIDTWYKTPPWPGREYNCRLVNTQTKKDQKGKRQDQKHTKKKTLRNKLYVRMYIWHSKQQAVLSIRTGQKKKLKTKEERTEPHVTNNKRSPQLEECTEPHVTNNKPSFTQFELGRKTEGWLKTKQERIQSGNLEISTHQKFSICTCVVQVFEVSALHKN